jgi:hypothetical protein
MLIPCSNKGCLKSSNALLNLETLEVICQECGKAIANISEPMKRVLKSSGQVIRSNEKKAFMVLCKACNANREVVLDQNNKTICKICFGSIALQATFKLAMQEAGAKLAKIDTSKLEEKKKE